MKQKTTNLLFLMGSLFIGTVMCSQENCFSAIAILWKEAAYHCWDKQSVESYIPLLTPNINYCPYRPIRLTNSFFAGCWSVVSFPFSFKFDKFDFDKKVARPEEFLKRFGLQKGKEVAEFQGISYISTAVLVLFGLKILKEIFP